MQKKSFLIALIGLFTMLIIGAFLIQPLISAAQSATPDIPDFVSYQGRLTDAGGTALTGTYGMTFCVYDQATAGNMLWCETQTAVSVTDGVFSVQLGSVNPLPSDLFDQADRYLGITITGDGNEMTPRLEITSNGYAYTAANADRVDGFHAHELAEADHDHHSLNAEDDDPQNAVYVNEDGNLGVGFTNPGARVQVHMDGSNGLVEAIRFMSPDGNNVISTGGFRVWYHGGTGEVRLEATRFGYGNIPNGGKFMTFYTNPDATSVPQEMMRLSKVGHLAIGTTNTSNILTIVQNSTTDPIADSWTTYSSKRWKTNIAPLDGALDTVLQLRGVSYDWKATGESDIGLIAEEVGKVVPEVVTYEANGQDARSVAYAQLVPVLIEAMKEQQAQIESLQTRIAELEATQQPAIDQR